MNHGLLISCGICIDLLEHFRSDGSINDRGFNLSYSVSPCGGLVPGPVASLTSPNYPANYPESTHCVWLLRFSPGSQIEITTEAFSLESDCAADNVTIRCED